MSASGGAAAAACNLGTFSSNGQDTPTACTPADRGSYVNTTGATAAILTSPGTYQPNTGQTSALLADPGYYVPIQGATTQIQAPVGRYVPDAGASVAISAPVGYYVAAAGSTQAAAAQPGTYVATTGATAATPAPAGSYVSTTAATAATPAPAGSYVSTTGATAATPAPAGFYVPTTGATSATLAPAGSYVATAGSTAPTAAPAGSYVANAGSSSATFAPIGSYVASTGQVAATSTSPGFYTYAPGASGQVPAGLMAGPLNSTIRANEASIRDASSMIDSKGDDTIKTSFYYQGGSVDQVGQSSGARQNISIWGLNLLGNMFGTKDEPAGVLANVSGANYSAGADGSGNGLGLSVGLFKKLQIETAKIVGTLLFGNYNYNSTRQNLTQGTVSGSAANVQTATGNTNVNTYGINLLGSLPLTKALPNLDGFLNLAVTNYSYKGMTESVSGGGGNPSAGLNTSSMNYLSIPTTLGLKYSLMDSSNQQSLGAISVGYKYDFGQSSNLSMSTQSSPSYQFGLPIALTNARATVIEISSANYEIQKNLNLSAAISSEFSSTYSFYQGNIRLMKSF